MKTFTAEQLQPFCENTGDLRRLHLAQPFTVGAWTYATNGRLAVRVPAIPGVPGGNVPVEPLFHANPATGAPIPLAGLTVPPTAGPSICPECLGKNNPDGCDYCEGDGKEPEEAIPVKVGHHLVSHIYLNLLKGLDEVQIYPAPADPCSCLAFTFDGGNGLLMPIRPEEPKEVKPPKAYTDEEKLRLAAVAVAYVIRRIQEDPDLRWHMGAGTEAFTRLLDAEQAITGKPEETIIDQVYAYKLPRQSAAEIVRDIKDALVSWDQRDEKENRANLEALIGGAL